MSACLVTRPDWNVDWITWEHWDVVVPDRILLRLLGNYNWVDHGEIVRPDRILRLLGGNGNVVVPNGLSGLIDWRMGQWECWDTIFPDRFRMNVVGQSISVVIHHRNVDNDSTIPVVVTTVIPVVSSIPVLVRNSWNVVVVNAVIPVVSSIPVLVRNSWIVVVVDAVVPVVIVIPNVVGVVDSVIPVTPTAISICWEITEVSSGIPMLSNWALVFKSEAMVTLEESFAIRMMWQMDGIANVLAYWASMIWYANITDTWWTC